MTVTNDEKWDYLGDAYHLKSGSVLLCPGKPATIPARLAESAVRANTIYLGQTDEDDACVIFVVGEIALKVSLTREEALLYGGMLLGVADRLR